VAILPSVSLTRFGRSDFTTLFFFEGAWIISGIAGSRQNTADLRETPHLSSFGARDAKPIGHHLAIPRNRLCVRVREELRFLKENAGGALNPRKKATRIGVRNVPASDRIRTISTCNRGLVALGSGKPEILSPL
jgi:hypothetical protein